MQAVGFPPLRYAMEWAENKKVTVLLTAIVFPTEGWLGFPLKSDNSKLVVSVESATFLNVPQRGMEETLSLADLACQSAIGN